MCLVLPRFCEQLGGTLACADRSVGPGDGRVVLLIGRNIDCAVVGAGAGTCTIPLNDVEWQHYPASEGLRCGAVSLHVLGRGHHEIAKLYIISTESVSFRFSW